MERNFHKAPCGALHAISRDPIGSHPIGAIESNLSIISERSSIPPALSPLAITTTRTATQVTNTQPISVHSSVEIPLKSGDQSPLPPCRGVPPPRISPIISSGSRDIRGRRYNTNILSPISGNAPPMLPVPVYNLPITPAQSVTTGSSCSSSGILQGAGGGRRIFKRIGMNCVYDIYGDDSISTEIENPVISEETNGLNNAIINSGLVGSVDNNSNYNSTNSNGYTAFVRPWLRQQSLPSCSFPNNGSKESMGLQETPLHDSSMVKNKRSSGKTHNLNFSGKHRRRHNCPYHKVINEGDVHVTEMSHKDSSHYIRSYSLTALEFSLAKNITSNENSFSGSQNHPSEGKYQSSHHDSTFSINGENLIIPPTPKSSATLSRTLSNLRAKSRSGVSEKSKAHRLLSPRNTRARTSEKNMGSESKDKKRQNRGIIQEMWCDAESCSSRSSSVSSTRSSSSDDGSCCSCCSCRLEITEGNAFDADNQSKHGYLTSSDKPRVVAYNNFFDAEDIPAVSVCSFRKSSTLEKNTDFGQKYSLHDTV
ncbi:uncharacterized protein TM35_000011450 [Trypanosoma theileri]|uniref:Uncharacterized protein n=1 Tax=Trypanosoma theileri TaxID=67003 RepID=A0A1X0P8S1_9TRYP|nr:uncharacterized protein TM35_000011450 [Trypanosoma theileri]ORC93268.1 hypothetical protein TM35_000011450 [Trypanosoma theileri]